MARRLGTIMIDMGYLDEEALWKVLEEQKRSGSELIGRVAVRLGHVKDEQVLRALGEQLGMKVVKLSETTIPSELTELLYIALPLMVMNAAPLSVYTTCPPDLFFWSCSTLPVICSPVANEEPVRPWV